MALNYLICLLDVIGRLATRNADNLLLRLMYGRRTAQARAPSFESHVVRRDHFITYDGCIC